MTLDEFLRELSARRGLHRKIGMVARYWRQVQKLPADKQQQVALALGSKAAWNRLETLFARDGTLSEGELAVKRALDRVGGADPSELRDLASKVRSGNYADVSRELVAIVGQALEEEAESDESVLAREEAAIDEDADPEDTAGGIDPPADSRDAIDDPVLDDDDAVGSGAVLGEDAPDGVQTRAAAHTEDVSSIAKTPVAPVAPVPPKPGASRHPPREVGSELAAPLRDEAADPAPLRQRDVIQPLSERAAALSAAEKLGVLRTLRTDPGYGARLGRSGRAELLARLGPGWAARRALSELIRSQAVDHLDEALRLTAGLQSETQRAWCLGDLVEHWDLDGTELEQVVEAAPSPSATRRLRRRHARQNRSR